MHSVAQIEDTGAVHETLWTQAVLYVSDGAHHKLPKELHGRLEMATTLVLAAKIHHLDDGTWEVDGHEGERYTVNGACDCEDYARGQAPLYKGKRYCKHRLAQTLQLKALEVTMDELTWDPDADAQDDEGWPPGKPLAESPAVPGPALPEAPASVNVRLTIAGRDVQLTLRGVEEAEVLTRLEAVLARYPQPALTPPPTPPPSTGGQGKGWCAIHNEDMRWNEGKDGRKGWYSHKVDGEWCKGRVRRA